MITPIEIEAPPHAAPRPAVGGDGPSALFVDQTGQLGGAELCMKDIISYRRHPHDQVILFQPGPLADSLRSDGITVSVSELGGRGGGVRKSSGLLRKMTSVGDVTRLAHRVAEAAGPVEVIYANTAKALVVSAIAGKLSGRPVIYHVHDILSAEHFSRSNRGLLVFLAKHFVGHTIANSRASADAIIAGGVPADRVSVIHNGIDTSPFHRAAHSSDLHRRSIRGVLGLDRQPLIALFGRFSPWKGQLVALRAIARLPTAHLMLVGDALFGEQDYVAALKREVADLGIEDRVHFMGFRDDVPALMQASDIVVHCSTAAEPFGRVIVEAMLSNRPVVATRAGGAAEIIRDQQTGMLVTPGLPAELAEALRAILDGRIDRGGMVSRAADDARQRFKLEDRVDDISAIIAKASSNSTDVGEKSCT